jgi:hypothetical protein
MTNSDQPQDINDRLNNIDTRLEELGDEIDLIGTIQNANRRETHANSQTATCLEQTVAQLADIAILASASTLESVSKTSTASGSIYLGRVAMATAHLLTKEYDHQRSQI